MTIINNRDEMNVRHFACSIIYQRRFPKKIDYTIMKNASRYHNASPTIFPFPSIN